MGSKYKTTTIIFVIGGFFAAGLLGFGICYFTMVESPKGDSDGSSASTDSSSSQASAVTSPNGSGNQTTSTDNATTTSGIPSRPSVTRPPVSIESLKTEKIPDSAISAISFLLSQDPELIRQNQIIYATGQYPKMYTHITNFFNANYQKGRVNDVGLNLLVQILKARWIKNYTQACLEYNVDLSTFSGVLTAFMTDLTEYMGFDSYIGVDMRPLSLSTMGKNPYDLFAISLGKNAPLFIIESDNLVYDAQGKYWKMGDGVMDHLVSTPPNFMVIPKRGSQTIPPKDVHETVYISGYSYTLKGLITGVTSHNTYFFLDNAQSTKFEGKHVTVDQPFKSLPLNNQQSICLLYTED